MWTLTLCRESAFHFPEHWGKFSATNVCQITIHLFILETWKHSCDGCIIARCEWDDFPCKVYQSRRWRGSLCRTCWSLETGVRPLKWKKKDRQTSKFSTTCVLIWAVNYLWDCPFIDTETFFLFPLLWMLTEFCLEIWLLMLDCIV